MLNSHLSWYTVASIIMRPLPETGRAAPSCLSIRSCFRWGLHSPVCRQTGGGLLPHLSILTCKNRRYISVALSLESPPPVVSRHPALRSPDFPHSIKKRDHLAYSHMLLLYPKVLFLSITPENNFRPQIHG